MKCNISWIVRAIYEMFEPSIGQHFNEIKEILEDRLVVT